MIGRRTLIRMGEADSYLKEKADSYVKEKAIAWVNGKANSYVKVMNKY